MKWLDVAILLAVAAAVAGAIWHILRRRKRGGGCCGSCANCPYGDCGQRTGGQEGKKRG